MGDNSNRETIDAVRDVMHLERREATVTIHCAECGTKQPAHEFYSGDNEVATATLIATNSSGAWRKEMCYPCWRAFTSRAFCSIRREGDTFIATCAF
jgi:hypothetical protein